MRILRHPAANAAGLSVFTAFYATVFFAASGIISREGSHAAAQQGESSLWGGWCAFLGAGRHVWIAAAMIAVTLIVLALLFLRRHPYDEYHAALLLQCLAVAAVLTLLAIAVFFLLVLNDPDGVVLKFTLFITIHWVTVVLADLVYVLLCRWR